MKTSKRQFALAAGTTGLLVASAAALAAPSFLQPVALRQQIDDRKPVQPVPPPASGQPDEVQLSIARIYWEFNSSANDLGVHVMLDGENWNKMRIEDPNGKTLFDVRGKRAYRALGMTELFFEGAEPSLDEFPLDRLLALFPEGEYEFEGRTVNGEEIEGEADFSHAIPAGPQVFTQVAGPDFLNVSWSPVNRTPPGFPDRPIHVVAYQVIVESYQVTVPASVLSVTVTPEFVATLGPGEHDFEVLAIEQNGNQSITEGVFVK